MLLKLIKYDFKATYVKFLTALGIFFLISTILPAMIDRINKSASVFISTMSVSFLFPALCVVTMVFLIQFYYKNLYCNEGYLMSTLPTNGYLLLISKTIVGFVWMIGVAIVETIAGFYCVLLTTNDMPYVGSWLNELSSFLNLNVSYIIICLIIYTIIYIISFQLIIYFCVSFSNLPFLRNLGKFCGFVAYFIISFIQSQLTTQILVFEGAVSAKSSALTTQIYITNGNYVANNETTISEVLENLADSISKIPFDYIFIICSIITLSFGIIFFVLTGFLLNKKINLK